MASDFSDRNKADRAILTLNSILQTINDLTNWNKEIESANDYYSSQAGMQLLAANCTLITAIGEGINRINRILPNYLSSHFPEIPWIHIIGMRNRIAHGYFELDAEIVFEAVKNDIPILSNTIREAIRLCKEI